MSTGTLATEASIIGGSGLTLTNELTVSGTGTSSFAGKVDVSGPTWNDLFEVGLTGTAEVFRIWYGGSYFSFAGGSGGTTEMVRVQHDVSDFQILSDKLTVTGTGTSSIAGLLIASNHVRMENTSTDYMTYDHEGFYRYSSTWTETTHWQFRNTWTAATGDMVYISNAGNQTAASDASMILSDNTGLTFGKGHADGNQLTTQVFSVAHSGNIVTSGTLTVSGTGISTIEGDLDIEAGALNVGNPSTKYTGSQGIRIKATGASEWFTMETGTSTWNLKDWSGTTLLAANGTTNAVNVPADFSVGGNVTVSGSGNHDFSGTLRTELIRDLSGDIMVYHDSNNLRLGGGNVLFTMGLWSGGAENITLDTSGNVAIPNGTLTVSGTGDSSFAGKILIKETSTNFQEDYVAGAHNPTLQVNDSGNGGMSFTQWHTTQTHGAYLWLAKSNNTSIGSHTVVNFNETLGAIHFAGSDGTTFNVAAMIQCQADLACGANDMPGRLIFSTTANAANTPTEAMRIDSSQNTTLAGTLTVSGSGDSSFVGSVGIGTTSIDELLHIEKDQATGTKIRIENESSANLAVAGIDFKSDGSNDFLYSYGSGYTANLFGSSRASTFTLASQSTNELNIGTIGSAILRFGTNNAERMQITSGGNVLIGTTTDAGQKFQVDAGVVTLNKEGARIEADITTNASAYTNTLQLSDGDSGTASIAFGEWNFASIRGEWEGSGAAGRLTFYNRTGSGAPTEKMRLTSTGDLLIGTTTAATNSLLTVNAGITVNTEGIEILEDTPTLNTNRLSQESGSLRWEGTVISLSTHVHSASDITSGILGLTRGGTGQNAADDAFDALSPSSARGDIAVMGVSKNTALNLGTAGLALVSDGTDLVYGTPNSRLPVNGTTYAVSGAGPTAIDPAAGGGIIKLTHSGSGQTVVKIEDTYATDGDMIVCVLTAETGSGGVRLTETGGASRLDGGGTCDLDNGVGEDTCTLMYIGNVWSELSRSDPF
ncbi:MAG: hypothetical protein COA57_14710 [Flavobacteriales bacterium]|nr:MAG: hypothetical protein COA57_14710 [Flavobacteriales bacterium]